MPPTKVRTERGVSSPSPAPAGKGWKTQSIQRKSAGKRRDLPREIDFNILSSGDFQEMTGVRLPEGGAIGAPPQEGKKWSKISCFSIWEWARVGKLFPPREKKSGPLVERGALSAGDRAAGLLQQPGRSRAKIFADSTRLEISTYSFGWCANLASPGPHRIMGAPRAGTKTTASEK